MAPTATAQTLYPGALYRLSAPDTQAVAAIRLSFATDGLWHHMAVPVDEVCTFDIVTTQTVVVTYPVHVSLICVATGVMAQLGAVWLSATNRAALRLTAPAGVTLYPVPHTRRLAKLFRRSLNICRLLEISPERSYACAHQHMLTGQVSHIAVAPQALENSRIAVLLHLHYTDLWPEFARSLAHLAGSIALIVTLTADNPDLIAEIHRDFPQADVRVTGNFGRDLGPFLALLDDGVLDRFDYVCKLHGKKSVRNGRATLLGDLWRRRSVAELLGCGRQIDAILTQFRAAPELGLMGVQAFRVPNARFSAHDAWGGNRAVTLGLASRIRGKAVEAADFSLDFFAGTMFWCRPQALEPLRGLGLGRPESYAAEAGHTDGALEHGLERIIPFAVTQAGYTVASAPPVF